MTSQPRSPKRESSVESGRPGVKPLDLKSAVEWRRWLQRNHAKSQGEWVYMYKKAAKNGLRYQEALDEALCFGWIDGQVYAVDEEKFRQRWTPRHRGSIWSLVNKARVKRLIAEGRMTDAGLAAVRAARKTGKWQAAYSTRRSSELHPELLAALKVDPEAWANFNRLAPSYQRIYAGWVADAKHAETRQRRVGAVVRRARDNRKPYIGSMYEYPTVSAGHRKASKRSMIREVEQVLAARPVIEGAGVHLKRAFGYNEVPAFDPFLMLDDFGSSNPDDYMAGFPWHPHRGIETVTYMLSGEVEHGDSIGNSGVIGAGDIQWMTAGSGIIHQEMPRRHEGRMRGFQLWVNLPKNDKMMHPRYRDIRVGQVPSLDVGPGVRVKVIAGSVAGMEGPVRDIVAEPEYLDVELAAGGEIVHTVPSGHRVFVYMVNGEASFGTSDNRVAAQHTVLLGEGDEVRARAVEDFVRLLLVSGRPIGEPVAWGGPIVMNTEAELRRAFEEYRHGTFIKRGHDPEV